MADDRRYCIIGAGYAGLGVAKAFKDAGIAFDWFERNEELGGNWLDGVYDSTHIISSRDTTAYDDFPMPDGYPDFPSRDQVLAYLNSYADSFGLRPLISFGTEVEQVEPLDERGLDGWRVGLSDGRTREYAGLVIANGHHWDKRYPDYPGDFAGREIHSKDYKKVDDFDGRRVLVVGAGNSGCDIAVEAAREHGQAYISMRRGYYFLPKTLFGIPVAELDRRWFPVALQKRFMKLMLRITQGSNERYGLEEPDHELFDHHPVVNSQLLYFLRHGVVEAKPDIERFEGKTVHFVDGSSLEVDTIVYATGFNIAFPFLDRSLFEWENGVPVRAAGMMAPGIANMYVFGLGQPRGGAGPLISAGSRLLAKIVRAQEQLDHPIADDFARVKRPDAQLLAGVQETLRNIRRGERAVALFLGRDRARRRARALLPRPRLGGAR
jgi:cation diffusion facilitator CzcD-associated flavoprotein CzcO